jgi:hypothetical protein
MPTLRQIQANRRNSEKSTGPKTPEGKGAASRNALKTGIYSKAVVLPFEDRAALDALTADFYARFAPAGPAERVQVDEFIRAEWSLRRLRRCEAELNTFVHQKSCSHDDEYPVGQPSADDPKLFSGIQWRSNAIRKARNEALATIRSFRAKPRVA